MLNWIRRFVYWTLDSTRETWRAKGELWSYVVIITGTCVLVIIGLIVKEDIVDDMMADIAKNPSAVVGDVWRTPAVRAPAWEAAPDVGPFGATVVPYIVHRLTIAHDSHEVGITLQGSAPGDPFLRWHGTEVNGDASLVLSKAAAQQLGIAVKVEADGSLVGSPPAPVTLKLIRGDAESHSLGVNVTGIFPGEDLVAYCSLPLADDIERFKLGQSVFGVPGTQTEPPGRFQGYIACLRYAYDAGDLRRLRSRGLVAERLTDPRDERVRLGGVMHGSPDLVMYWVAPALPSGRGVGFSGEELQLATEGDDIFFPWNEPIEAVIDGRRYLVVGVTARLRRWLKCHFRIFDPSMLTDNRQIVINTRHQLQPLATETVMVSFPAGTTEIPYRSISLPFEQRLLPAVIKPAGDMLREAVGTTAVRQWQQPFLQPWWCAALVVSEDRWLAERDLAIVSATQLSRLSQWQDGRLAYDSVSKKLLPISSSPTYQRAQFWAPSITDVPQIEDHFSDRDYNVLSNGDRVREMLRYEGKMSLLVSTLVLPMSAVVTVLLVILNGQMLQRKRRDLALRRLLGTPALGLIYLQFVRCQWIWLVAALLVISVGVVVHVVVSPTMVPWAAVGVVLATAALISGLATVLPAVWIGGSIQVHEAITNAGVE